MRPGSRPCPRSPSASADIVRESLTVTDGLPDTIPSVRRTRRDAFADTEALVDERDALTFARARATRAGVAARARSRPASSPATASRSGRPTSPSGCVAALGVYARRRRDRAAEHAVQGRRGRRTSSTAPSAKLLFTVTDFLDTELRRPAPQAATRCRHSSTIVVLRGRRARGHARLGPTSSPPARHVDDARSQPASAALTGDTRLRHHLHVGHDRPAEGRDAHARRERRARTTRGRRWSGSGTATAT